MRYLAVGLLLLLALQDADRLRLVAADTLRLGQPEGFWTEARVLAAAERFAELGDARLIDDDAMRRRFDALLLGIGADCPYRPVPEVSEISRLWNDAVFELWMARLRGPLAMAKSKLRPTDDARRQARDLARAVNAALEPAREMLEREEFVVLLSKQQGFLEAETLYAAIRRIGEERLAELPDRLDRPEFAEPLKIDPDARHVSNYIAEGRLRDAVNRLGGPFEAAFNALIDDLYLAPVSAPMPVVEPDAHEIALWERLAAMRTELAQIAGAYEPDRAAKAPAQLSALAGKVYNPGDYQTKETLSHPTRKSYLVDPNEIEWAIANEETILTADASFEAADGNLRLTWVRPGSILQTRGFQTDDVVQRVNGLPIGSLEDVRNLKTNPQFQNARVISVVVNRAGTQVYLTYSIPAAPQQDRRMLALLLLLQDGNVPWIKDFAEAEKAAARSRRPILIYFCCD